MFNKLYLAIVFHNVLSVKSEINEGIDDVAALIMGDIHVKRHMPQLAKPAWPQVGGVSGKIKDLGKKVKQKGTALKRAMSLLPAFGTLVEAFLFNMKEHVYQVHNFTVDAKNGLSMVVNVTLDQRLPGLEDSIGGFLNLVLSKWPPFIASFESCVAGINETLGNASSLLGGDTCREIASQLNAASNNIQSYVQLLDSVKAKIISGRKASQAEREVAHRKFGHILQQARTRLGEFEVEFRSSFDLLGNTIRSRVQPFLPNNTFKIINGTWNEVQDHVDEIAADVLAAGRAQVISTSDAIEAQVASSGVASTSVALVDILREWAH